ncbi:MAG: 2-C-methyl-D-erythritol 2,4-cyclodiphosphate synthase [Acidimicrobiia bacterium]|nr:2-C-methyl-D-erythritol 2,4-cyclodiphosphate synthase [Acidimicrobiia bacterium]
MRVSWGFDAHRLGGAGPITLAGVPIDSERGVVATSDGDLVAHAVADAVLAVAGMGDLGEHFPSADPRWKDANSMELLGRVVELAAPMTVSFVDVTVIAQDVRIAPHRRRMEQNLATVLGLPVDLVSVKATTTDHLGWIGSGDGIAATAVVTADPT